MNIIHTKPKSGGGGSQTPWTSDINGGGFTLSNAIASLIQLGVGASPLTNTLIHAGGAYTSLDRHAFDDYSVLNIASPTIDGYASYDAYPTMNNSANIGHYVGYQSRLNYNGSANITDYCFSFASQLQHTGAGNIGTYAGYRITNPSVTGGGSISYNRGIWIDDMTAGATENYSILTEGTSPSKFGGKVTAGGLLVDNAINADYDILFDRNGINKVDFSLYANLQILTFGNYAYLCGNGGADGTIGNLLLKGSGGLSLQPNSENDITCFDAGTKGAGVDGNKFSIYRNSVHLDTWVNQYGSPIINSSGDLFISANYTNSNLTLWASGFDLGAPWASNNPAVHQYGYITAISASKYAKYYLDTDGYFHIGREDANVLGCKVDMPMSAPAIYLGNGTNTNQAIMVTDIGAGANNPYVNYNPSFLGTGIAGWEWSLVTGSSAVISKSNNALSYIGAWSQNLTAFGQTSIILLNTTNLTDGSAWQLTTHADDQLHIGFVPFHGTGGQGSVLELDNITGNVLVANNISNNPLFIINGYTSYSTDGAQMGISYTDDMFHIQPKTGFTHLKGLAVDMPLRVNMDFSTYLQTEVKGYAISGFGTLYLPEINANVSGLGNQVVATEGTIAIISTDLGLNSFGNNGIAIVNFESGAGTINAVTINPFTDGSGNVGAYITGDVMLVDPSSPSWKNLTAGTVSVATMPTADPADGRYTLWMDSVTRIVRVGT